VVGDHGEGMLDHHEDTHGLTLYRSTLHVPLILHPRPDKPLAHARPWRLEDLEPTIRDWFELGPNRSDGANLFEAGGEGRLLPSLTIQPTTYYGVNPCLGMRRGALMYMRHGLEELYDMAADPDQRRDLAGDPAHRGALRELREACRSAFPPDRLQSAASSTVKERPADLQNLRSLGYLGGFVPDLGDLQRADIRRVCDDQVAFKAARAAFARDRDSASMRRAYGRLLARYPNASLYHKEFGDFLLRENDQPAAARAFESAIRLNPRDATSMANLGGIELLAGRTDRARALFESVLTLEPDDPVVHRNLGILFSQHLDLPEKAVLHFKRYLELVPGTADAATIRGYILRQEGVR
jgi:tetratricopeptide (TPR) repeat protein